MKTNSGQIRLMSIFEDDVKDNDKYDAAVDADDIDDDEYTDHSADDEVSNINNKTNRITTKGTSASTLSAKN